MVSNFWPNLFGICDAEMFLCPLKFYRVLLLLYFWWFGKRRSMPMLKLKQCKNLDGFKFCIYKLNSQLSKREAKEKMAPALCTHISILVYQLWSMMLAALFKIRKYYELNHFGSLFEPRLAASFYTSESILSFEPGMNEAQLYEGLFSWLAFYTFSNFVRAR